MSVDAAFHSANVQPVHELTERGEATSMPFEDVYTRYLDDIFRYALVLTRDRDEAEEVAAETFARALRAWRKGGEPAGLALPWLLAITRNVSTDRWRRAKRVLTRPAEVSMPPDVASVESLMWLEAVSSILPARQREVIALRYHRDLSDADIGNVMGLSQSGVRSLVARAIETLRKHPEVWR